MREEGCRQCRLQLKLLRQRAGIEEASIGPKIFSRIRPTEAIERYRNLEDESSTTPIPKAISLTSMERLLGLIHADDRIRQICLAPYRFAIKLRSLLEAKRIRPSDAANLLGVEKYVVSKYLSGNTEPKTAAKVNSIACGLGFGPQDRVALLEAAEFTTDAMPLERSTVEGEAAIERILREMQSGVGGKRIDATKKHPMTESPFRAGLGIRGRKEIENKTSAFIVSAASHNATLVRANIGDYFSASGEPTPDQIRKALLFALERGTNVRCLTTLPLNADASVTLILESLDLLGRDGEYRIRAYESTEPEKPVRGVLARPGKALLFFPREEKAEDYGANFIEDCVDSDNSLFEAHFDRRYGQLRPLIKYYGHTLEEHCRLEKALAHAEEKCSGRFLIKARINGLMVPPEHQDWERKYLEWKYSPPKNECTARLFNEIFAWKQKRVEQLASCLLNHQCRDICSRRELTAFLKNDRQEFRNDSQESLRARIGIIDRILKWLDEPNYMLALTDSDVFSDIYFQISKGDTAFFQVHGQPREDFHLEIFEPYLTKAFEGRFLSVWESISPFARKKSTTVGLLSGIRTELKSQL